jgi:alpha,alpha-trehalase
MRALSDILGRRFLFASGLEVEPKDGSVAIHYRRATRARRAWAHETLCEVLAGRPNLRLMRGKKVWEILPEGAVDKWKAVQLILDRENFIRGRKLLVYLGDDVTDEVVFRKMRGLSVFVGRPSRTAAAFYLKSQSEVTQLLHRIEGIIKGETIMVGMSQGRLGTQ